MAAPNEVSTPQTVYGSGYVYVARKTGSGPDDYELERYLGDTPGFELQIQTETSQVYSSDGQVPGLLEDVVRQVDRSFTVTVQNVSIENYGLFVLGGQAAKELDGNDRNTPVASEAITPPTPGAWHQLGMTAARPFGHGAVASAGFSLDSQAVVRAANAVDYTGGDVEGDEDVDYILDAPRGRIYITEAGAIGSAAQLPASVFAKYVPANPTNGYQIVKTGAAKRVEGALRYVEDAGAGKGSDVYARLTSILGSGSAQMKSRDTPQQITLACTVKDPPSPWPALAIRSRA